MVMDDIDWNLLKKNRKFLKLSGGIFVKTRNGCDQLGKNNIEFLLKLTIFYKI